MQFGISYYPELIDESEWSTDLQRMRESKLSILRVLEFAWSAIEPREGVYTFEWFDRFMRLAEDSGFQLVLCTPTATPPVWLTSQYPEVMVVRRDGIRHHPGGRRDVDLDSEILHHYSAGIVREMGRRYGKHPAVVGWQLDNELIGPEGEPPESHSRATLFRFRQFLRAVHGDIATLNRRWGTKFWSQEYSDWGEVGTPINPRTTLGHVLDYSRYFTHSLRNFLVMQARVLREEIDGRQWISHNSTAVFDRGIDHTVLSDPLDVVGWDAYPGAAGRPYPHAFAALAHDLFRSAKHKPFWVLETSPVRSNVTDAHFAQMQARGAEAALMWHWREHRSNAEYESDVFCDYAGRPDPVRVERLTDLQRRLDRASRGAASAGVGKRDNACAILFCPDCVRVHLTPDPYMKRAMDGRITYLRALVEVYRALWQCGVAVDVVRPGDALDRYRMLVLPSAKLLSVEACERVARFVQGGGTLLATAKTAHQDPWATYYPSPGEPLSATLGFAMQRSLNLPDNARLTARWDDHRIDCLPLAERVSPTTAQVLASFEHSDAPELIGSPAATKNAFGKGAAYYASAVGAGLVEQLLALATKSAGVPAWTSLGSDVGLFPHADGKSMWVFNHSDRVVDLTGDTVNPGSFSVQPIGAFKPLS